MTGRVRFLSAGEAAAMIKDGDTVAISGNGAGMTSAEAVFAAIERRFLATGSPKDLTLVHSLGLGDRDRMGTNRFAHEGLLRRVIAAHFTWSPAIQRMIRENKVEAYCFPGGVIQQLLREIGAGRPGLFTSTGLGTFADPRQQGGRCNAISREQMVELLEVDGRETLRYKPFDVNVALIRGTFADERGNISPEEEAVDLDIQSIALAAHNSGGVVIAQVRQMVNSGTLRARSIRVPGILVDAVVEDPLQEQFYGLGYDLTISGQVHADSGALSTAVPERLERRVIARRAAMEIQPALSMNFGFGIPGGIFGVIAEQGTEQELWMSVEQGAHNGRMLDERLFGASRNPDAIISSVEQFDYYSGGGIDIAFLGMGEADSCGNVNVSHLGGVLIGPGGFIEIAQNAKKVVFCGTLEAQGANLRWDGKRLEILKRGSVRKFVKHVERITFSGSYAAQSGQEVLFITERAVFRLTGGALELIEVAPGLDVETDVIACMEFRPAIASRVACMPESVFGN